MASVRKKTAIDLGVVDEDFEQQPVEREDAAVDAIDVDANDALAEEASILGAPHAPVLETGPSARNNPYLTEEMQGMEMQPKVMGPPPYGSPDPATSAGRLLPVQDHPLANLPEGHPAEIADDYGADAFGATHPSDVVAHPLHEIQEPGADDADYTDNDEATAAAQKLAAENNVDLDDVDGTGADGRVTKGDVEKHIAENAE